MFRLFQDRQIQDLQAELKELKKWKSKVEAKLTAHGDRHKHHDKKFVGVTDSLAKMNANVKAHDKRLDQHDRRHDHHEHQNMVTEALVYAADDLADERLDRAEKRYARTLTHRLDAQTKTIKKTFLVSCKVEFLLLTLTKVLPRAKLKIKPVRNSDQLNVLGILGHA